MPKKNQQQQPAASEETEGNLEAAMGDKKIFPLTLNATVKSTRTNAETGERTITLSVPKSEAGRVAQLSVYDKIVFQVKFVPDSVEEQGL